MEYTNLNKVFWPKTGHTKKDLLDYYEKISDKILPYLVNRPLSMHRNPNGVLGGDFFQKRFEADAPKFLKTRQIRLKGSGRSEPMVLCQNKPSLLYLVNLGNIEFNPWNSKVGSINSPDYFVLDLDPLAVSFKKVVEVALVARSVINSMGFKPFVKTSGATGIHIYTRLPKGSDYHMAIRLAKGVAEKVNQALPGITSVTRKPKDRVGKVYLDFLQNSYGQTVASAYSVRPQKIPTVSAPLYWSEVGPKLEPKNFTLDTMQKRIRKLKDPWKDFFR